jgi:TolB-like protein/DNA-binding SARP family transcriptional activator
MADEGRSRQEIWASEASLTLLGSLRLVGKTGEDWTPKPRKTRALLAIVALAKGSVTRSRLTDLLWGDRGEDQAKASLRQALYELRDLSSSGLMTVSRDTVAIGPKWLWTDVSEVETAGEPSALADTLEEVEWPPLRELDDVTPELDEWLRNERVRLSTLLVQKGIEAAENATLAGEPMLARRIADSLERIDPLDERATQAGARADIALGDRAAAHRRIERLKKRLGDELGLEPSGETRALLAESPASRAKPAAAAPTPTAAPRRRWFLPVALMTLFIVAAAALYILRSGAAAAHPNVAVLPFEEAGPKTQGYFATGVSDEILNLLSHEDDVRVLGRVSAEQIADRPNALDVARKLGLTHLLDGSVRRAGDRVLVIVTLTRVSDGTQMWSERYERRLGDIFAVQGDIARTVASRLSRSFGTPASQATSPEVYDRYLAARQLVRERTEVALAEADRLLREAIRLDPRYAPAYAELAQVLMLRSDHPTSYGSLPIDAARSEAAQFARRAIQLDPSLGDAYAAMGFINLQEKKSAPFYRKAVELSPQRPEYHRWLATSLSEQNRFEEGIEEYRRAIQIDPLWYINYEHLAGALAFVGRNHEARQVAQRFMALSSDERGRLLLLRALANNDLRSADNVRFSRMIYDRQPDERLSRFYYASALSAIGEHRQARPLMARDAHVTALLHGDWSTFARLTAELGRNFWDRSDLWESATLLVASGHSDVLVKLYDEAVPLVRSGVLDSERIATPATIVALRNARRPAEANRLLRIYAEYIARLPNAGIGDLQKDVNQAFIASLSGRQEDALRRLDELSRQTPLVLGTIPTMSLLHNPALSGLRTDRRLAQIDERLRAALNAERQKAGLRPISREGWVSDPNTLLTKN